MNKVFLVDNKHICEVPLAMREELTRKILNWLCSVLVRGMLSGMMGRPNTPICRGLVLLSKTKTQTRRAHCALFFIIKIIYSNTFNKQRKFTFNYVGKSVPKISFKFF